MGRVIRQIKILTAALSTVNPGMLPGRMSGMSLISIIFAIGLLGVLGTMFAQSFIQQNKAQTVLQSSIDEEALRRFIIKSLDCAATAASISPNCTVGNPVEVKSMDIAAPTLITTPTGSNYTKIGYFSVMAVCDSCPSCSSNRQLKILFTRFDQSGRMFSNSLTGNAKGWVDLNRNVPLGCQLR